MIQIPKRYYIDHEDNATYCKPLKIIKETKLHFYIEDKLTKDFEEFVCRAEHYADPRNGLDHFGIVTSARATIKALEKSKSYQVMIERSEKYKKSFIQKEENNDWI